MTTQNRKDVIVIGAGASGLFCAAECGRRGRAVLVLDHASRAASKVLISGGGRCNFTNLGAAPEHYRSHNPHFCKSALARFTPRDILALCEKHHIASYEKEAGQMFCVKSSREIAALLGRECERSGVEQRLSCSISNIAREGGFVVTTDQGEFRSDALVIATGGLSYEKLGASGFGLDVAKQFGLTVVPPLPALVPFLFPGRAQAIFKELAGVSLDAALTCRGKRCEGSILFTHRGLSGPAVLQASLYWTPGDPLLIDLLPNMDIFAVLMARRRSTMEMRTLLAEHLPRSLAEVWCGMMADPKPLVQTSDQELRQVAERLHEWTVLPTGTEGYDTAEVTAGGVDTDELSSKTMESKKVPGLYFIGEVVDVTGELGGYNLHWAWASGFAAGQYA